MPRGRDYTDQVVLVKDSNSAEKISNALSRKGISNCYYVDATSGVTEIEVHYDKQKKNELDRILHRYQGVII